jgi:signal transduction histidine kinase/DNA-binding response OmpR family regulator
MNTRAIAITGYCLLVLLAIGGFVTIYLEVIKSNWQSDDSSILKQELIDLNNTLTTMYQAEGTINLLALAHNEKLRQDYDSLNHRMLEQINSLRIVSSDPDVISSLDSLSVLLSEKRKNTLEMLQLMRQIDRDIVLESAKSTVITRDDTTRLNTLLVDIMQVNEDTIRIAAERRGLLRRIGNVFRPDARDTLIHISRSTVTQINELQTPLLTDTIIDFVTQINQQAQRRNAEIAQRLIVRQQELYINKELTGFHINKIMDSLNEREYQTSLKLLSEKNELSQQSARLVAIIAVSALIVALIFMSWTVQSINKAQRLQKKIQEAKKHAEKLLVSREQLIYTITHDIKAPLSSITGFLDLMPEDMLSQKQQYYVDNMHSSASHILELMRNLLDFHSYEKEQPRLATVVFSPDSLIRNIYDSFLPLAQKKKINFELNSTVPETQRFLGDPYYIRQIVNNLLSNAIKYTPEEGEVSLLGFQRAQNYWKILVQDNGPGIAPENQAKIFEEFVRLDDIKNKVEGTGLGLTISKQLASLLGGTIEIESETGKGSVFTLTIPITPATEKPVVQPKESSGRILFVDDDRTQLNLIAELMKRENWNCICCSSVYEALDILKKQPVDMIFTDICIPDLEGLELVKRIQESDLYRNTAIPVIAFSASCRMNEVELKAAGFDEFLPKPFKVNQLIDIIEKHTSLKRKTVETHPEKNESGWRNIMDFVSNDSEAAINIIDSFIEETNKDKELLSIAFQKNDTESVQHISHKMLSMMRTISAQDIVSILTDFERGAFSEEKKVILLRLIEETLKEAKVTRRTVEAMEMQTS